MPKGYQPTERVDRKTTPKSGTNVNYANTRLKSVREVRIYQNGKLLYIKWEDTNEK